MSLIVDSNGNDAGTSFVVLQLKPVNDNPPSFNITFVPVRFNNMQHANYYAIDQNRNEAKNGCRHIAAKTEQMQTGTAIAFVMQGVRIEEINK